MAKNECMQRQRFEVEIHVLFAQNAFSIMTTEMRVGTYIIVRGAIKQIIAQFLI